MLKNKRLMFIPLLVLVLVMLALVANNDPTLEEDIELLPRTYDVGYKSTEFTYVNPEGHSEQLSTAFWYPTSSVPEVYTYNNNQISIIALEGEVNESAGPYPLIVLNHGLGADELDPLYLKEYLASEGYIVASCDFNDNLWGNVANLFDTSTEHYDINSDATNLSDVTADLLRDYYIAFLDDYRTGQASFIIDKALEINRDSGSFLYGMIDETAIGMGGHSLGGLSTISLIGGHPDNQVKDDRIKAALLLSSPIYPFDTNLDNIAIPLMTMTGEYDVLITQPDSSWWYHRDLLTVPNYYLVLKDAHHFTFSSAACDNYSTVQQCQYGNQQVNTIECYSLAFFNYYLKNDSTMLAKLTNVDDAMLTAYEWRNVPD
jgi:predicted dienelactone hydrolase